METWISDIESMFQEGLTDIHFPSDQWAALSSKNTLKIDLMQHTAAMAGLPFMMGMNGRPTTMLGAPLAGENPLKFSYGFVDGPNLLYELGILTFSSMATYGRPIAKVNGELITNKEQVNGFITEGEELSPEEVAQLINYLKNTDFDDPNRKSGIQTLPPYDEEITFEGMRKVLGGNGPGTPDGLAPYAMGTFNFFTEDVGTMLSADATSNERLEAAAFTFIKPAKMSDTALDAWKTGEKVKDAGKGTVKGKGVNETNLRNIDDFKNGNKKFDEVIEDYAKVYKEHVDLNKPWSWDDTIPGGDSLSSAQKRKIKEMAIEKGHIPEIKVTKADGMRYGFTDFASAGVVEETVQLPEKFWKLSDKEQFKWLDEQIGGTRKGMTWHHTEVPGKMELVPFGIHNITPHNGGRTKGMWADAPR